MRVLLIEDNPGDVRLVQELLKEAGGNFVVRTVERLESGLALLASEKIDAVLLDLNLPDSHGLDTLTRLRAQFSNLPVVIMTGSHDEALGIKSVQLGAQDYLVKGQVDGRLLWRVLTYAIERKEMEQRFAVQERLAFLGKMAGTIAHEVRNPLATVDTSAYYLEKTLGDAGGKTKEHLQRMRRGVNRAASIIEKLLEMSRMRHPELRPIELSAFVADTILAAKVPLSIQVISNGREKTRVMADHEQLRMALGNILRNAIEAMPEGGTLRVDVREADDQAEVLVKDTGTGISPETFNHLFEPLFTTKPGGVGFGLALARTIIERHGGTIEAKSGHGKGATFVIHLPLLIKGEAGSSCPN